MEKEMAAHSSILAWRIPWMEEPGGLLSMGSHRVGHDWSNLACMHVLEKEMATHSSILAWSIPGTEEPRWLPSMGLHRVGHNWNDLAAVAKLWNTRLFTIVLCVKMKDQKWLIRSWTKILANSINNTISTYVGIKKREDLYFLIQKDFQDITETKTKTTTIVLFSSWGGKKGLKKNIYVTLL